MSVWNRNLEIEGPADLYNQMVEIKAGKRGFTYITKKQARECKIKWSFVEQSAELLELCVRDYGPRGVHITRN
jgi:hypothetical protein